MGDKVFFANALAVLFHNLRDGGGERTVRIFLCRERSVHRYFSPAFGAHKRKGQARAGDLRGNEHRISSIVDELQIRRRSVDGRVVAWGAVVGHRVGMIAPRSDIEAALERAAERGGGYLANTAAILGRGDIFFND